MDEHDTPDDEIRIERDWTTPKYGSPIDDAPGWRIEYYQPRRGKAPRRMDDTTHELDNLIPHQPPFRLIDAVEISNDHKVVAVATPRADDPLWSLVYAGHYPGSPVTPGVLLCEMAFQAGAVLMARKLGGAGDGKVPVVARIQSAKFRRMVPPDTPLRVTVTFVERLGDAFVLKGVVASEAGESLRVEFVVTLAPAPMPTVR